MTAFFHRNHQPPFPLSPQEMTNEAFSFLCYQAQCEAIPKSSSTDPPRSRASSISDANASHCMEEKKEKKRMIMMKKKRNKCVNNTLLSPVEFKETKHGRNRKQKKPAEDNKEGREGEEPPLGYIHVRARRGQATDSHSLAERVRREKISERMKVLQGLVPGCEKVVGKALMLDEIINYVQSLQNQVEFLSMKLACVNPVLFDSVDYDCLVNQPEFEVASQQPLPSPLLQASIIQQPPALDHGTAKAYEALLINSPQTLLQSQGPIPLAQENGSLFMQVGDQRSQELLNYMVLSNMCSFQ